MAVQAKCASFAIKKTGVQILFQLLQLFAECRLADIQSSGCPGDRSFLSDDVKVLQVVVIHEVAELLLTGIGSAGILTDIDACESRIPHDYIEFARSSPMPNARLALK